MPSLIHVVAVATGKFASEFLLWEIFLLDVFLNYKTLLSWKELLCSRKRIQVK